MKNGDKSFPTFKEFYTEQSTVSKIGQGAGKAVGSVAAAPFKLAGGLLKGIGSAFKKTPATPVTPAAPKPAATTPAAKKPAATTPAAKKPAPVASTDNQQGMELTGMPADVFDAPKPAAPVASTDNQQGMELTGMPADVFDAPKPPADSEFETPKNPAAVFTPASTTPASTTTSTTTPKPVVSTTTPASTTASTTPASTTASTASKITSLWNKAIKQGLSPDETKELFTLTNPQRG